MIKKAEKTINNTYWRNYTGWGYGTVPFLSTFIFFASLLELFACTLVKKNKKKLNWACKFRRTDLHWHHFFKCSWFCNWAKEQTEIFDT